MKHTIVAEKSFCFCEPCHSVCFPNLTDQCFHHFFSFQGNEYKDDINTENPLGAGGKLAIIFAKLMRDLWLGRDRSLSPYNLKVKTITVADV